MEDVKTPRKEDPMAKQILVVDDETAFLLGIRKILSRSEAATDVAETIEEAEHLLKEKAYDIVITDLRLTGVLGEEGLEILQYVREHNPQTKCILVTGYGSPDIREKAMEKGAAYYFEKPVSPTLLLDAVQKLSAQ